MISEHTTKLDRINVLDFYQRRIDCLLRLQFREIAEQASKLFDCILTQKNASLIVERALSQQLINVETEYLTDDPDFYLKFIELMRDYPATHRLQYEIEYDKAVNRFTLQFLQEFATAEGGIDWAKLVKFNSGKRAAKSSTS